MKTGKSYMAQDHFQTTPDPKKAMEGPKIEKNPKDYLGSTPLHKTAENGHLEICQLIIENVNDKNPTDFFKSTPLHKAAANGYVEICQLIMGHER